MDLAPTTFVRLTELIHRLCGLVIPTEKAYLIRHRLEPVLEEHGLRDFEEMIRRLGSAEGAALHEPIIEAITTKETSFFRDGHPFETIRRDLLPPLGERAQRGEPVRLWSAAASTGQEAYSLAMLILDYVRSRGQAAPVTAFAVLATDISTTALATGAAGEYPERDVVRGVTPQMRSRHFDKRGDTFVVREAVRRLVEFRRVNLTRPLTGLGMFDGILFRNLLIYFDDETRRKVCERLSAVLRPGGWLLLGSAENLLGVSTDLTAEYHGETLLYRKPDKPAAPARAD
jgi:chemotaxis protein methyltransferase CheR